MFNASQNPFADMMKSFAAPTGDKEFGWVFDPAKLGGAAAGGFDLSSFKNMFPADFMKSWQNSVQNFMPTAAANPVAGAFTGNPFGNISSMMPKMDAGSMGANVDWQSLAESQKKNMEMWQSAHHTMMAGAQQATTRLSDLFRHTMQTAAQLTTDLMATGTPEEKLGRQVDIVKSAFDLYTKHMHELAELSAKGQTEALDMFSQRLQASLDELKDNAKQAETRFHDAAVKADLSGAAAKPATNAAAATSDIVQ